MHFAKRQQKNAIEKRKLQLSLKLERAIHRRLFRYATR